MILGEKIKNLRKNKNLSQGELAEKVGINPSHLSKLEKGKYQPSVEVLKNLADTLEVTTDYLLSKSNADPRELQIEDETLAEKIRLLNTLDGKEKEMIIYMIDTVLTKKKMLALLQNEIPAG